jgi:hypothetical protein
VTAYSKIHDRDTASVTTPATASCHSRVPTCGRASAHGWKPKIRADSAYGRNAPGSLSMVIVAAGSKPPQKKAFQLSDMDFTAAE